MSIYSLKPKFQNLLRPFVRTLAARGVTANQVTLCAMGLSIVLGLVLCAFGSGRPYLFVMLPILLFIRMALNAIDGMLAREFDMKSKLGAILNEVGDIVSDAALYVSFVVVSGVSLWGVLICILLSIVTEVVGILGQTIGGSRRYDGPLGKSDRAFFFGALGLAIAFEQVSGVVINILIVGAIALLLITTYNRTFRALREVETK